MTEKPIDNRHPIKFPPEEIEIIKKHAEELATDRGVARITYRDAIMEAVKFHSENRAKTGEAK